MKPLNITVVGTGGSASYLLPLLVRAFEINRLTLYDEDILEERNLERQLFDERYVGENKASALAKTLKLKQWVEKLVIKKQWFTSGTAVPSDETVIFSCADNHVARKAVLETVDRMGISNLEYDVHESPFAVVLGNEYYDAEAYIYLGLWKGGIFDPRIMYPEINTDKSGDPASCQGIEQVANPQLALANARSADHALSTFYVWLNRYIGPISEGVNPHELKGVFNHSPFYIRSGECYSEFYSPKLYREIVQERATEDEQD